MSRKDYIITADSIREIITLTSSYVLANRDQDMIDGYIMPIASRLKKDNEQFNLERFIDYICK